MAISVDCNRQSLLTLVPFVGTFYCYVHASPVLVRLQILSHTQDTCNGNFPCDIACVDASERQWKMFDRTFGIRTDDSCCVPLECDALNRTPSNIDGYNAYTCEVYDLSEHHDSVAACWPYACKLLHIPVK